MKLEESFYPISRCIIQVQCSRYCGITKELDTQINETEWEPSNNHMQCGQFIFYKAAETIPLRNNGLFKNCAIVIGYTQAQNRVAI